MINQQKKTIKDIDESTRKLVEDTCRKYHTSPLYNSHVEITNGVVEPFMDGYHPAYHVLRDRYKLVIEIEICSEK